MEKLHTRQWWDGGEDEGGNLLIFTNESRQVTCTEVVWFPRWLFPLIGRDADICDLDYGPHPQGYHVGAITGATWPQDQRREVPLLN